MRAFGVVLLMAMMGWLNESPCMPSSARSQAIDARSPSQQIECDLSPINRTAIRSEGVSPLDLVNEAASTNWSGYVGATNMVHPVAGSVSFVSGVWTVPVLHATPNTAYSAAWVGIDGFSSATVEQIGTAQNWVNGVQQNYAWFEMYPQGAYEIVGFPVNKGDLILASVRYSGSGVFQMIIENITRRVYFIVPSSYTHSVSAQRSCAEWIMEAPSSYSGILPLANFGSTTFSQCLATIGGISAPIVNTHWQNEGIEMETSGRIIKSLPSLVYDVGMNFMVTWEHQ